MELVSVSTTVGAPGVGGGGPGVGVSPAGGSEPPEVHSDEVYCMDYISDMKVSDATQLTAQGGLLFIQDTWKPDWEKPIQVTRRTTLEKFLEVEELCGHEDFIGKEIDFGGLAARGLIKQHCSQLQKSLQPTAADAKWVVGKQQQDDNQNEVAKEDYAAEIIMPKYNCDEQDTFWLSNINKELFPFLEGCDASLGSFLSPELLEFVFDFLEETVHGRLQLLINSEKGGGIEFDENTLCDVCREGTCEEGNEIVFCDKCDLGVHQGCYGIFNIPEGDWLCKTCYLGIKPRCFLCPHRGGAMKPTVNGKRWCHVSCVLWVNETSFGDLYKMEPVIHLKSIPDSRWALVCTLCRQKVGACIQCSFKTCAVAYHVTCGFDANLEITTDQHPITGDLRFKSYCPKHTAERRRKKKQAGLNVADNSTLKYQKLNAMKNKNNLTGKTDDANPAPKLIHADEQALFRKHVLKSLCKFHSLVTCDELAQKLNLKPVQASVLFEYWKLKRMSTSLFHSHAFLSSEGGNEDPSGLGLLDVRLTPEQKERADVAESLRNRTTMFVSLRQDFEKVRNMMTLIQKRERALKSYHRVSYEMFKRQLLLAGFDLLPDFLCPPSDLVQIQHPLHQEEELEEEEKQDIGDNITSSADEGIESGDHSDVETPLCSFTATLKRKPCQELDISDHGLIKRIKLKPSSKHASCQPREETLGDSKKDPVIDKLCPSKPEIKIKTGASVHAPNGTDHAEKAIKKKHKSNHSSVYDFPSNDRENGKKSHKVLGHCFKKERNDSLLMLGQVDTKVLPRKAPEEAKEPSIPQKLPSRKGSPLPLNGFSVASLHCVITADEEDGDEKPSANEVRHDNVRSRLSGSSGISNSSQCSVVREKILEKAASNTLSINAISSPSSSSCTPHKVVESSCKTPEKTQTSLKQRTPSKISPQGDLIFNDNVDKDRDKEKATTLSLSKSRETSNIFISLESSKGSSQGSSPPVQCLKTSSSNLSSCPAKTVTIEFLKKPSNLSDEVHYKDPSANKAYSNCLPESKATSPSQVKALPPNGVKSFEPPSITNGDEKTLGEFTKTADTISVKRPNELSLGNVCAISNVGENDDNVSNAKPVKKKDGSPLSLFEKIASGNFLDSQSPPLTSPTEAELQPLS